MPNDINETSTAKSITSESDTIDPREGVDAVVPVEQPGQEERFNLIQDRLNAYFDERDLGAVDPVELKERWYIGRMTEAERPAIYQQAIKKHPQESIGNIADIFARLPNQTKAESSLNALLEAGLALKPEDKDPTIVYRLALAENVKSSEDAIRVSSMAKAWSEKFLRDEEPDVLNSRRDDFFNIIRKLSDRNVYPRPVTTSEEKEQIFEAVMTAYEPIYEYQGRSEPINRLLSLHKHALVDNSVESRDANQALYLTEIFNAAIKEKDTELAFRFYDVANFYNRRHPLSEYTTLALITNVLPRMINRDPSVDILQRGGNVWGMNRGDFGIGDFVIHSLVQEVTPKNLNELLMALREIPTSDAARLEQNRRDGLQMAGPFGVLRDFIHDQRPGVHEVLAGMLEYYDTGNPTNLQNAMDRSDYLGQGSGKQPRLLDLHNYNEEIDIGFDVEEHRSEMAIDVLRRLEKNTRSVDEEPPEVSDVNLHAMLEHVANADEDDKKQAVQGLTKYLNGKITDMIAAGTVGVEPSFISVLAWAERQQFKVLQGIKFEDQVGLAKQAWFKEVLKFHELTHTHDYREEEFNTFVASLQGMGDVTAARAIVKRTLLQVQILAENYTARGKRDWTDALWSGNVTHELIGLVDRRPAVTAIGKRLLAEQNRSLV